jgi:hypothetical protein
MEDLLTVEGVPSNDPSNEEPFESFDSGSSDEDLKKVEKASVVHEDDEDEFDLVSHSLSIFIR